MIRFHHVNLGIPPGGVDAEASFLTEVLGYQRAPLDDEMRALGALWFDASDGSQIHLSEDPDHRAPDRAHVAIVVGDELDAVVGRLTARGADVSVTASPVGRVAFCRDPAGNRWELRSA